MCYMYVLLYYTVNCNSGVSSIALRMGGETWVFDAGEGTQIQIQRSPVKPTKISKVLIVYLYRSVLTVSC
jgi:ribonuclease BN (tRNA processing enzyme)